MSTALENKAHIKNDLVRSTLGEFVGTFLLLLLGNSVVAVYTLSSPKNYDILGVNIGFGLAIAFGVAVCARLSGGHINPAVSLMFLSFGALSPIKFIAYVVAQFLGAFFGSATAYAVYSDAINHYIANAPVKDVALNATAGIFASYPGHSGLSLVGGFVDQTVATAVFCFLIAHFTDAKNAYPSYLVPILVGVSFIGIGTAFAHNAGYPCNPARDLAPRVMTLLFGWENVFTWWWWIPVVAPFVGGLLGGWFYKFLIGFHTDPERKREYVVVKDPTKEEHIQLTKHEEHHEHA